MGRWVGGLVYQEEEEGHEGDISDGTAKEVRAQGVGAGVVLSHEDGPREWVVGWVGKRKIEEEQAVRMSYCELGVK